MPNNTMAARTGGPARKLVVGNWKMHGILSTIPVLTAIDEAARVHPVVEIGLALPATLIIPAWQAASAVRIGAQDIHAADQGAHTGCVSAAMVRDAGATFTLVGHSECRAARRETDAEVRAKALAARRHGLSVIVCVGEALAERRADQAEAVVRAQLLESLPDGASGDWLSVAYEPIWAIGTGMTPSAGDIAAMHRVLRDACVARCGQAGQAIRLLYGGSVGPGNVEAILATPDVDGVLVGGASLALDTFLPIVASASRERATATVG